MADDTRHVYTALRGSDTHTVHSNEVKNCVNKGQHLREASLSSSPLECPCVRTSCVPCLEPCV